MEAGIVRQNDDASGIAGREAAKMVYGADSPYARQPQFSTIEPLTVADLQAWHDKTVLPNDMIVAVSGDFDPVAMEATLRKAFGGLKRGPAFVNARTIAFPGPNPAFTSSTSPTSTSPPSTSPVSAPSAAIPTTTLSA